MNYFLATSAIIEKKVAIGEGSEVWYFTHIRETAKIGKDCKIGDSCFIDTGVIIGDGVKLANGVKVYGGAIIKDNVYLGPDVKITDVRKPRANKKGKQLVLLCRVIMTAIRLKKLSIQSKIRTCPI